MDTFSKYLVILYLGLFIGEATYLDDIPYLPNELHGALVQATQANAKVAYVDASEALNLSGVVTFVTAADIPGRNSFVVGAGAFPDPVSSCLVFLTVSCLPFNRWHIVFFL